MHKEEMTCGKILAWLRKHANRKNIAGMARFGINPRNTLGIPMPLLRAKAKELRSDHDLALALWETGIHEARILAGLIADPRRTDERLMEAWAGDFDSWDVCDQVCSNLFDRTAFAWQKAAEWSRRDALFVKRAGFVLMAALAVHDRTAEDVRFLSFLPFIKEQAHDDRNFVKKAVNWALRQMGKRNRKLNKAAIAAAREIQAQDSSSARWIAADALRELTGPAAEAMLLRREQRKVKSSGDR